MGSLLSQPISSQTEHRCQRRTRVCVCLNVHALACCHYSWPLLFFFASPVSKQTDVAALRHVASLWRGDNIFVFIHWKHHWIYSKFFLLHTPPTPTHPAPSPKVTPDGLVRTTNDDPELEVDAPSATVICEMCVWVDLETEEKKKTADDVSVVIFLDAPLLDNECVRADILFLDKLSSNL